MVKSFVVFTQLMDDAQVKNYTSTGDSHQHRPTSKGADCDVIIRTHYRKLLEYPRNSRDDSENGQRNDVICFGFVGGEDKEGRLRKSLSNHDGIWNCVTSIFW